MGYAKVSIKGEEGDHSAPPDSSSRGLLRMTDCFMGAVIHGWTLRGRGEARRDGFPLSRENGRVMGEEGRRWVPAFAGTREARGGFVVG